MVVRKGELVDIFSLGEDQQKFQRDYDLVGILPLPVPPINIPTLVSACPTITFSVLGRTMS